MSAESYLNESTGCGERPGNNDPGERKHPRRLWAANAGVCPKSSAGNRCCPWHTRCCAPTTNCCPWQTRSC